MIIIAFLIFVIWASFVMATFNWAFEISNGSIWGFMIWMTLSLLPLIICLQLVMWGKL